ncbi:SCO2522 family protein [Stackebrandtia nassauensis]|uniref:Uncharacterized protein n=1 Tax=Stackebrandtia nassauensis (strain DSM 44728 / CIP 108903 / NRRL B-16338 / NBRC 102104 / LLR-40K-21) TaxID=446470 RepID=D3QB57_STANL|nr:SCO2522 family protein [Stackebrandtia nassauensis]ADD40874.1 hypothetical protein Snas_1164 [Stackebrandtia nassauensis DSM 44728]
MTGEEPDHAEAEFLEETAASRVESVPLSHLSIELGHLYSEDYEADDDSLVEFFRQIGGWVRAAETRAAEFTGTRPRVSTCFMVDDYFGHFGGPREVVPRIEKLAHRAGVRIDYLARESACAAHGEVRPARLVEARIVAEPIPGDNGNRPPTSVSGWLSNGERSGERHTPGTGYAMGHRTDWQPPKETAANRHSVFVDVELWSEEADERVWSCAYLASVWQLLRLGLLRDNGDAVGVPAARPEALPSSWDEMPAVTRLEEGADPFNAYRTLSIMDSRFLRVEDAVRVILNQIAVESEVDAEVLRRAKAERMRLPSEPVDRLEYVFTGR